MAAAKVSVSPLPRGECTGRIGPRNARNWRSRALLVHSGKQIKGCGGSCATLQKRKEGERPSRAALAGPVSAWTEVKSCRRNFAGLDPPPWPRLGAGVWLAKKEWL